MCYFLVSFLLILLGNFYKKEEKKCLKMSTQKEDVVNIMSTLNEDTVNTNVNTNPGYTKSVNIMSTQNEDKLDKIKFTKKKEKKLQM